MMKKHFYASIILALVLTWPSLMLAGENSLSNHDLLVAIDKHFSKTLPMQIDEVTRLDEVKVHKSAIERCYTILNLVKEEMDVSAFSEIMSSELKLQSCRNKQSLKMFKRGISEWHSYTDKNDTLIATIKIDRTSCK